MCLQAACYHTVRWYCNSLVATSACTTPGTQQQIQIELLEIEQEELLQDDVVRRDYAQRCVGEEEVGGEEETETEEEDEEQEIDCGHLLGSEHLLPRIMSHP